MKESGRIVVMATMNIYNSLPQPKCWKINAYTTGFLGGKGVGSFTPTLRCHNLNTYQVSQ